MSKLVEFTVAREHQGDRITDDGTEVHLFLEGETRLADPSTVATLVQSGVLVDPNAKASDEKAEEPHEDKSEGDSKEDKADHAKTGRNKGK